MKRYQRTIYIFDKNSERVVDMIDISDLDLSVLKSAITPYENDPHMIMSYNLTEEQAKKIRIYIDLVFDFKKYIYELSA